MSHDLRFELFVSVLLDVLLFSTFLSHDIKNRRGEAAPAGRGPGVAQGRAGAAGRGDRVLDFGRLPV